MRPHPNNQLLGALTAEDWDMLEPLILPTELETGRVVAREGEVYEKVYFPITGVIATMAYLTSGIAIEVATIGCEGMSAPGAILGSSAALKTQVVQLGGPALALPYPVFHRLLNESPGFRGVLMAYAQAFLVQMMQTVACNAVHTAEERAARWLLMCRDRAGRDTFPLTQEFFAEFMGVSRPTINLISRTLQRAGLISYKRGMVTVLDRAGLEETACECYQIIHQHHVHAMTPLQTKNQRKP